MSYAKRRFFIYFVPFVSNTNVFLFFFYFSFLPPFFSLFFFSLSLFFHTSLCFPSDYKKVKKIRGKNSKTGDDNNKNNGFVELILGYLHLYNQVVKQQQKKW